MANEVDNSKEEKSREGDKTEIKASGAELQKEFMLTTLQSLTRLLNDVMIIRQLMLPTAQSSKRLLDDVAILLKMMKYLTFSIISLALSFIFWVILYWL